MQTIADFGEYSHKCNNCQGFSSLLLAALTLERVALIEEDVKLLLLTITASIAVFGIAYLAYAVMNRKKRSS